MYGRPVLPIDNRRSEMRQIVPTSPRFCRNARTVHVVHYQSRPREETVLCRTAHHTIKAWHASHVYPTTFTSVLRIACDESLHVTSSASVWAKSDSMAVEGEKRIEGALKTSRAALFRRPWLGWLHHR
jgi:hypothetical protein